MAPVHRPHITIIVGSGRDLVRAAPLYRELRRRGRTGLSLVLTGQERDADLMSGYFRGLALPQPDGLLEPGVGTRPEQTARIFAACETFLRHSPTDLMALQGAADSILACAVIGRRQGLTLAQLEGGLRRARREPGGMIGEVVDHLCDCWFAPWGQAAEALIGEGLPAECVRQRGNLMIDTLHAYREPAAAAAWDAVEVGQEAFGLVVVTGSRTLDNPINLRKIAEVIAACANDVPIVFPLTPEGRRRLAMWHLDEEIHPSGDLFLPDAKGFLDTYGLIGRAIFLITDSPDLQDQASYMGVPCLTLADATDRLVTLERGTNLLVGTDAQALVSHCQAILEGRRKRADLPDDWDGRAAGRIADDLDEMAASAAQRKRGLS